MKKNIEHIPICPKCGYDQSGIISTWEDQCPMTGRCPECGLEFEWADVFDPGRVLLPWYIEHTTSKRTMCRRVPSTLWMMFIPYRFWKCLSVHYPVYLLRVWGCVVGSAVAVYLLTIFLLVCIGTYSTLRRNQLFTELQGLSPGLNYTGLYWIDMANPVYWLENIKDAVHTALFNTTGLTQNGLHFVLITLGMSLLWLIVLCVIPTTRRMAKIRLMHVHRAMALSCFVGILGYLLALFLDTGAQLVLYSKLSINSTRFLSTSGNFSYSLTTTGTNQFEMYANLIVTIGLLFGLIWVQWFWITAIVVGWRIRSVLLAVLGLIASLLAGFTVFMYLSVY